MTFRDEARNKPTHEPTHTHQGHWPAAELRFHLYGRTNEGLVQKQSAEICNFFEKGIILMRIMGEPPLRGHICDSPLFISPLLIKTSVLKSLGTVFPCELNIKCELAHSKAFLLTFSFLQTELCIAGVTGQLPLQVFSTSWYRVNST